MTNQQILEKAIQKAIDGGWTAWGFDAKSLMQDCMGSGGESSTQEVIFNHDFAKALWGEDSVVDRRLVDVSDYADGVTNDGSWTDKSDHSIDMDGVYSYVDAPAWQYHLQQMVIAKDPIKYLGEHI